MMRYIVILVLILAIFTGTFLVYTVNKNDFGTVAVGSKKDNSSENQTSPKANTVDASLLVDKTKKPQPLSLKPLPRESGREPVAIAAMPEEVQTLFSSDEMTATNIYSVSYSDGSSGFAWEGQIGKTMLDAYSGWRNRLKSDWGLIFGERRIASATLEYENSNSMILVSLKSLPRGRTKQSVSVVVKNETP